jgi:hypothetical protein
LITGDSIKPRTVLNAEERGYGQAKAHGRWLGHGSDLGRNKIRNVFSCCILWNTIYHLFNAETQRWSLSVFFDINYELHVQVLNCHDSVIYILAPVKYATVYGCSDTTVVLGAVGKVCM